MLQRFCHFISENNLFQPTEKIILTVSGGVDSIVMADLFHRASFQFAIAHCNFQLRGEESDQDEKLVKELAAKYKIPFYRKAFDTSQYAEQYGVSIQMAARDLRYAWFNELIEKEGYCHFATAHHRNDVFETILLNLTKGTGIQGLTGIRLKVGKVIRPLLPFSRESIQNYAKEHGLIWREDSSNLSSKYQRNLIRLEVIPLLKKINPSLEDTFESTLERIRASETMYQHYLENCKNAICKRIEDTIVIQESELNQYPESMMLLYELVKDFGFNYSEVKKLYQSTQSGKIIHSSSHSLSRDRDSFILSPNFSTEELEYTITEDLKNLKTSDVKFSFSLVENKNFKIPTDPTIACIDYEKLNFPLKIRTWQEGDWFLPLGLGKKKKVSDLLVDLKTPIIHKKNVKLLLSNDSVVWVVGKRLDNRFKITSETQRILEIRIEKG